MNGIKMNGVSLFLGKIPTRKQHGLYFVEGVQQLVVAYIKDKDLQEAERLWGKMLSGIPEIKNE